MRVTDIYYEYFQDLVRQSEALKTLLKDDQKYFNCYESGLFIKQSEIELIEAFKKVIDERDKLKNIIMNAAERNRMSYWEFKDKYETE